MKELKLQSKFTRLGTIISLLAITGANVSCTTTYDSYGRPVQSVNPGVAVAGAAAALVVGMALADDDRRHHRPPGHYRRNYRRGYHCR